MAKKVAYVVFVGRKTGIFTSWDEVKAQVNGFPGQKQQGYTSMADAEAAWAAWTSGSGAGNTGVCSGEYCIGACWLLSGQRKHFQNIHE